MGDMHYHIKTNISMATIAFEEKLENAGSLKLKHVTGNYKFLPNINEDDLVYFLLSTGRRKFDAESTVKLFEDNQYGVLSAIRTLLEKNIITLITQEEGSDNKSYQLDTAKVLTKSKNGDKLKFIYPSTITIETNGL